MSDREGVLETFSEGNPGLSVDLVQAWRFVASCCHPQCQKASSPSQELSAPTTDALPSQHQSFPSAEMLAAQPTSQG